MVDRISRILERALPTGVGKAAGALLDELSVYSVSVINGAKAARQYKGSTNLKIQLGCGPRVKPGWVNIDLAKTADVRMDMRRRLPFSDNSCAVIYSEHFLEHIDYPGPITTLLQDCLRILQPGGLFTFAVPDIDMVLRAYVNGGSPEYWEAQRRWGPAWCSTHVEFINYNFRQDGEHRFAYDAETMTKLLSNVGFVNIRKREFDPALDSKDRIVGSLYMDARKT
ncbi:MAG TPA: methyltransferase domain-containing protein [Bacteroidota bacterium]|nr:methyltransferase domain-containing protein [Bacteroidota bacterium]